MTAELRTGSLSSGVKGAVSAPDFRASEALEGQDRTGLAAAKAKTVADFRALEALIKRVEALGNRLDTGNIYDKFLSCLRISTGGVLYKILSRGLKIKCAVGYMACLVLSVWGCSCYVGFVGCVASWDDASCNAVVRSHPQVSLPVQRGCCWGLSQPPWTGREI